jgi:lipoate-protein ligase B
VNGSLRVAQLGLVDYAEAWELQRRLAALRRDGLIPDTLLLLEHPHTYTLGRRANAAHILLTPRQLARRGIKVYDVDRGGDVTYHGPGQLVGYPILMLEPGKVMYVEYIRALEAALLQAIRDLGVDVRLHEGYSGVWVADEKICAIGVKIDGYGVTSHGFALNVSPDLAYFANIVPCGIADKGVTSLDRALRRRITMRRVEQAVVRRIAERFGLSAERRAVKREALEAAVQRLEERVVRSA